MTENRCPNCDLLNLPDANVCLQCKTSLTGSSAPPTVSNISTKTAEYEKPTAEYSQPGFAPPTPSNYPPSTPTVFPGDSAALESKTGRRTHFWYRIFCSLIVIPSVVIAIFGFLAIIGSFGETGQKATDAFAGGIMFLLMGVPPMILYFFGVVLPSKPYHWFYGIFLLGMATLSCGLAIFAIPLLIFWVKPETQAYFERK